MLEVTCTRGWESRGSPALCSKRKQGQENESAQTGGLSVGNILMAFLFPFQEMVGKAVHQRAVVRADKETEPPSSGAP